MPILNTRVTTSGSNYSFTQGSVEYGTDGRTWSYNSDSTNYLFFVYIVDGGNIQVGKSVDGGTPSFTANISSSSGSAGGRTMCIDRGGEYLYLFANLTSMTYLYKITIATMAVSTIGDITSRNQYATRTMINSQGDKLIWTTNDARIYRSDLDGSNLEAISIVDANPSFSMTTNDQIVLRNGSSISIIDSNFSKTDYLQSSPYSFTSFYSQDSFIIGDYYYDLAVKSGVCRLSKWQISTQTFIDDLDLLTEFSISVGDVFNLHTDGTYGYFFVNDAGSNKFLVQFNLSTLAYVKATWVNDSVRDSYKFDGSGTVADLTCNQGTNNCDPAGVITSSLGVTGA